VSAIPALGSEIPRRGNRSVVALGRFLLRALGWRIEGEIPNLGKLVIAVAPHTSNWDFVVGMAAMFALDLRLTFIGKHTLFAGPLAPLLRWMGGIPVDRSAPHGVVGESIRAFGEADRLILAIAPQGTRKPVPHFKSGFLHIARGAGVPVLLAALDYETCCVRFGRLVRPGDDIEAERERIEAFFATVRGRHPR
jgi:1-acyl-sn-glycerol-3-phosphate acyltransferase